MRQMMRQSVLRLRTFCTKAEAEGDKQRLITDVFGKLQGRYKHLTKGRWQQSVNSLRLSVKTQHQLKSILPELEEIEQKFQIQETAFWLLEKNGRSQKKGVGCYLKFNTQEHFAGALNQLREKKYQIRTEAVTGRKTSVYHGVSYVPERNLWRASISLPGGYAKVGDKEILGFFRTHQEAARAYDEAARRIYGDKALTNFASGKGSIGEVRRTPRKFFGWVMEQHPQGLNLRKLHSMVMNSAKANHITIPESEQKFFEYLFHHCWTELNFNIEQGKILVSKSNALPTSPDLLSFEQKARQIVSQQPKLRLFEFPMLYRKAFGDFPAEWKKKNMRQVLVGSSIWSIQEKHPELLNPNSKLFLTQEEHQTEVIRLAMQGQPEDVGLTLNELLGLAQARTGAIQFTTSHLIENGYNHLNITWTSDGFLFFKPKKPKNRVSKQFARDEIYKQVKARSMYLSNFGQWFRETYDAPLPFHAESLTPFLQNCGLTVFPTPNDYLVCHKDNMLKSFEMAYFLHNCLTPSHHSEKDQTACPISHIQNQFMNVVGFVPNHLEMLIMDRYQFMIRTYTSDEVRFYSLRDRTEIGKTKSPMTINTQSLQKVFDEFPHGVRYSEFVDAFKAVHGVIPTTASLFSSLRNLASFDHLDGVDYKVLPRNMFSKLALNKEIRLKLISIEEHPSHSLHPEVRNLVEHVNILRTEVDDLKRSALPSFTTPPAPVFNEPAPPKVPAPVISPQNEIHDLILQSTPSEPTPLIRILHSVKSIKDPLPESLANVEKLRDTLDEMEGIEISFNRLDCLAQNLTADPRWAVSSHVINHLAEKDYVDITDKIPDLENLFPSLSDSIVDALRWKHRLTTKESEGRVLVRLPVEQVVKVSETQVANLHMANQEELNYISSRTNCYLHLLPDRGTVRIRGHQQGLTRAQNMINEGEVDREIQDPLVFLVDSNQAGKILGPNCETFNDIVTKCIVKMNLGRQVIHTNSGRKKRKLEIFGPIRAKLRAKREIESLGVNLTLSGKMPRLKVVGERIWKLLEERRRTIEDVSEYLQKWTPNFHPELYGYYTLGEMIASFEGMAIEQGFAYLGDHTEEKLDFADISDDKLRSGLSRALRDFNRSALRQILEEMKIRCIMPDLKSSQEMLILACKKKNESLAKDFFAQMVSFDLLPSLRGLKKLQLLLRPQEFSELLLNAEISPQIKPKWDQMLADLAIDSRNPSLLSEGDEFGKLQLDLLHIRAEDVPSMLEWLGKFQLDGSNLASILDLPWSGKTMPFAIVEKILELTTEHPDVLENPVLRKRFTAKLQAAAKAQINQGLDIPDSFLVHLQALTISTKPFTSMLFDKLLTSDISKAKEIRLLNDELNDEASSRKILLAAAERGSVVHLRGFLDDMKVTQMNFDRSLVRGIMKGITSANEDFKETSQKILVICRDFKTLIRSSDFMPLFRKKLTLEDFSWLLRTLQTFTLLEKELVLAAADWAIRDGQESLMFLLNLFYASNIVIDDEVILTKVMSYFADQGNSEVALEVFQKLMSSDQQPTLEMFKILLRLFVKQANLELAQYIVEVLDSANVSLDLQAKNLILQLRVLQGDQNAAQKIKQDLENDASLHLDVDSYNALLSYTWQDDGEYLGQLLSEMDTRKISRNVESYSKIMESCKRPSFPNLSTWILDEMKDADIQPSSDIARNYLSLCDTEYLDLGLHKLISLNAELDGGGFEIIVQQTSDMEQEARSAILRQYLRNMGKHTEEKHFLRVVDLAEWNSQVFWEMINIMREKAVVPTEESLSALIRVHRTSLQQREATDVLEAIVLLEKEGLFFTDDCIQSLCQNAGLSISDGEFLQEKIREGRREKRRKRLGLQMSLRQELSQQS